MDRPLGGPGGGKTELGGGRQEGCLEEGYSRESWSLIRHLPEILGESGVSWKSVPGGELSADPLNNTVLLDAGDSRIVTKIDGP